MLLEVERRPGGAFRGVALVGLVEHLLPSGVPDAVRHEVLHR
jgi:hypothetical protein